MMRLHPNMMKRIGCMALWLVILYSLLGCDYARMKEQEALQTYKTALPEMPAGTIPVGGGIETLKKSDPKSLRNPLPFSEETTNRGRESYAVYCIMCHGPKADGNGTVGQSFHPLPTALRDPKVQAMTDGEIFYNLSFGIKRQPPMAYTVSAQDLWAIVHYIRFLGSSSGS